MRDRTDKSAWSFLGSPELRDSAGSKPTLLMWAAAKLKLDLIDHLLNARALVNERDGVGRTSLHCAVSLSEKAVFSDVKMSF